MPRVYVRKFDHEEARKRYEAGARVADLAREYGVTDSAVSKVVVPERYAKDLRRKSEWQRNGTCPDCGGRASRNHGKIGQHRCISCAAALKATSVREHELRCSRCREWKPDDAFSSNRKEQRRRGRHKFCRRCSTVVKREYRERNRERERAYTREYRRRRRLGQ